MRKNRDISGFGFQDSGFRVLDSGVMERGVFVFVFCLFIFFAVSIFPKPAFAVEIPTSAPQTIAEGDVVCPSKGGDSKGLIVRVIPCIRDTVLYTSAQVFVPVSKVVSKTVTILSVIAISVWGIMLMAGQPARITRDGMILGVKIAIVALFTSNYSNLFPMMLSVVEDLMNVIAKPATELIWIGANCKTTTSGSDASIMGIFGAIDCYLDLLIGGIFTPVDIKNGIIVFLVSALVTNAVGFFVGIIGLYLIWISIITIIRIVYIYLTAIIAFSLMVIVSPIFVPMILFKITAKRFEQWSNLTISFLVQPIFVMGYLVMFLMAFHLTVFDGSNKHSLYYAIAGEAAAVEGFKIGDWLNKNAYYAEKSASPEGVKIDPKGARDETKDPKKEDRGIKNIGGYESPKEEKSEDGVISKEVVNNVIEHFGAGTAGKALNFFRTDFPVQAIDWKRAAEKSGFASEKKYKMNLFLSFIMSVIVMYVFFTLLNYMPFIGSGLHSESPGRTTLGAGKLSAPGSSSTAKNPSGG